MLSKRALGCGMVMLLSVGSVGAAASDLADAAMNGDREAVRSLLEQQADVNAPQIDGSTALHWAVRLDDVETAELLISSGADVSAPNIIGVTPMRLATINGNAAMIEELLRAGADPNAPLTQYADTALMMAARTGRLDAIDVLLAFGADVNATETWGGTTALMWAISEHHPDAVEMLIDRGAEVDVSSKVVAVANSRGVEGTVPEDAEADWEPIGYANGGLTPLLLAAREGELDAARSLVASGAEVNATAADGKTSLNMAIYNGNYELASFLVDNEADVSLADAEGFTPLFWAVDRRNMEYNPGFPWTVTVDPLPLIRKLLDVGADPNTFVNNTPRSRRNFGGSPLVTFSTALMRAAYSGDAELVRLLLAYGADPNIFSSYAETPLLVASGYGWIDGYSQGRSDAERLETIKLLIELGADLNFADDTGLTPLMVAANYGVVEILRYLIDQGADLGAHDLGKKNRGCCSGSVEPLMPIDYAIGVGTFRPNNAILVMQEATEYLTGLMEERGIIHTTSECTLRAFECYDVDPLSATPDQIDKIRGRQVGNRVDGVTGGLEVVEEELPVYPQRP